MLCLVTLNQDFSFHSSTPPPLNAFFLIIAFSFTHHFHPCTRTIPVPFGAQARRVSSRPFGQHESGALRALWRSGGKEKAARAPFQTVPGTARNLPQRVRGNLRIMIPHISLPRTYASVVHDDCSFVEIISRLSHFSCTCLNSKFTPIFCCIAFLFSFSFLKLRLAHCCSPFAAARVGVVRSARNGGAARPCREKPAAAPLQPQLELG